MTAKLTAREGDYAKFEHESGTKMEGVIKRVDQDAICLDWTLQGNFAVCSSSWTLLEVERAKPPAGTFIKGVDDDGDQFVGVVGGEVNDHRVVGGFWDADGYGGTNKWDWEDIREWGVIA